MIGDTGKGWSIIHVHVYTIHNLRGVFQRNVGVIWCCYSNALLLTRKQVLGAIWSLLPKNKLPIM